MFEFIPLVLYILCDCVYFCIVDVIFPLLYYNQNPKQEFSYPLLACIIICYTLSFFFPTEDIFLGYKFSTVSVILDVVCDML